MPADQTRAAFLKGASHGAPFLLVVFPFGMLFGVVATEAGLDIVETMTMSALVIAGASQFATLELLQQGAPAFIAVLTGLVVNMRMAMYSASMAPHIGKAPGWARAVAAYFLVDQVYAVSIRRFTERPEMTGPEKLAYYFGVAAPVCPFWYVATWLGIEIGAAIPASWSLDFAVPICFCAVAAPMLRGLPNLLAAGVAIVIALLLAGLPYNAGLIVAALVGMGVGAFTELRMDALRARAGFPPAGQAEETGA
ncbi:AzlC family ABC transporter permease [Rhodovulum sp. DZ06]|uniref:AzlC family ABC transporter permease n=1 Tax=Rhodovulum sp. DZ06 TaxID=3425126 RepID=UPI003D33CEBA